MLGKSRRLQQLKQQVEAALHTSLNANVKEKF
jgi:hypothetical protein